MTDDLDVRESDVEPDEDSDAEVPDVREDKVEGEED